MNTMVRTDLNQCIRPWLYFAALSHADRATPIGQQVNAAAQEKTAS